jgi:predicted Fe-Mo cluster-binding NifX family protein
MSKVAVMMSADRADSAVSSHFGKAEWIMIAEPESGVCKFVKNESQNGRGVVEILVREGCTDAIFTEIGQGALMHLKAAQIRGWGSEAGLTGEEALRHLEQALMEPVESTAKHGGQGSGGCCGGHGHEHDQEQGQNGSSCCHG